MDYYGIYRSVNKVISSVDKNVLLDRFELKQNYLNPFNPNTNVEFVLPVKSKVELKIFNIMGELLETKINEEVKRGFIKSISILKIMLAEFIY